MANLNPNIVQAPPYRTPLVNLTTGLINTEWLKFFASIAPTPAAAAATTTPPTPTPPTPDFSGAGAFTAISDTNVTAALGGLPQIALLQPVSLTLGWSGLLSAARGGTGIGSYAVGDLLYASGTTAMAKLSDVAAGSYLRSGGVGTAPLWSTLTLPNAASTGQLMVASGSNVIGMQAPAAVTKTNDTNVTLSLGGAPATALVNAASLTLGWTGTLAVARGGTGTGTAFTAGSVVFAGASGVYSQDNAKFSWDDTAYRLNVVGSANVGALAQINLGSSGSTYPGVGYNVAFQAGNIHKYLGTDTAYLIQLGANNYIGFLAAASGTGGSIISFTTVAKMDLTGVGTVGILTNTASQSGKTTLGASRVLVLADSFGGSGVRQEIGMGYAGTYQPIVLGEIVTSNTGYTLSDFYIATRAVTTDTSPTERFYIKSDGNVGIGTTGPGAQLDVKGSGTGHVTIGAYTGDTTYGAISLAGSTLNAGGYNILSGPSDTNLYVNRPTGKNIYFLENNGTAQVTILNGGNVGIGTTGPNALLSVAEKFHVNASGLIPRYNNSNTAGWGVPAIYGFGRSTAQTAAVASVATYTLGAADASFWVSANVNVTTSTLHSFTVQVAYTDETNTVQTLTLTFSQLGAALVSTITNATGVGPYEGIPLHIRCKASTSITIKTAGTFTTVTYNVEGTIIQLA